MRDTTLTDAEQRELAAVLREPQPPKFDLYVYEVDDGHDDLDELGDVLRAWAQPRGRRFSLMRSIPRAEAVLLARRAPGDRDALLEAVAAIPFYPDAVDGPVDVPTGTSRRLRDYRAAVLRALAADSRPEQAEP